MTQGFLKGFKRGRVSDLAVITPGLTQQASEGRRFYWYILA